MHREEDRRRQEGKGTQTIDRDRVGRYVWKSREVYVPGRFKSQIAVVRREAKAHEENETGSS